MAVSIPVWLSVRNPGSVTDSDTQRGLTVRLTAKVGSLDWSMGEPGFGPLRRVGGPTERRIRSECATLRFICQLRSLPSRTGGAKAWTVTVTVTGNPHWDATNGQSGDMTRTTSTCAGLYVGEYRTVMVTNR